MGLLGTGTVFHNKVAPPFITEKIFFDSLYIAIWIPVPYKDVLLVLGISCTGMTTFFYFESGQYLQTGLESQSKIDITEACVCSNPPRSCYPQLYIVGDCQMISLNEDYYSGVSG